MITATTVALTLGLLGSLTGCAALAYALHLGDSVRRTWNCLDQGHSFQARYSDAHDPKVLKFVPPGGYRSDDDEKQRVIDKSRIKVYECDVCRYCGDKADKTCTPKTS
jgi:hypothetical protein